MWWCGLTVQQSGGDRVVEAVAAVAAVAAGNLIIVGALQRGEVRRRTLVQLPFQDPTHGVAPPTGHFRCWYVQNVRNVSHAARRIFIRDDNLCSINS